jgi:hypothetical protein
MSDKTKPAPREIELSIQPHVARPNWQVVRVNFDTRNPDHEARVSEALRILFAPASPEKRAV